MLRKSDGLRCSDNYLDGLIKNANSLSASRRCLKAGEITVNVRGLRPVTALNWAYKRCFIRHITCKMKWKWHQTFSKDSVPSEIQWYKNTCASFWFLNVHLPAHVYSTKPFGKVLILWWVATNKCMYVTHIPQHNNLNPTSLLITLTVCQNFSW